MNSRGWMAAPASALAAVAAAAMLATATARAAAAGEPQGRELVRAYCSGCHHENAGQFERISNLRKTPEGWLMTLFRMRQVHGLQLEQGVRDSLVRYLADTQGLAPSEAKAGRFALERRPNVQDLDLGPQIGVMCGRCHSLARVSLQRRDADEWRKLAHTHVGQWASLEYQASGRDRPWFQIATGPLPAKLAALYPLSSTAWTEWQQHVARDLSGTWVVLGHVPGGRDFHGTALIDRAADARGGTDAQGRGSAEYRASYQLTSVDGIASSGGSKAIVYTGYEWRGSAKVGDRSLDEVYAVSEDGNRIQGRWFDADHAEDGGEWVAVRDEGAARIVGILPHALRAGTNADVTIVGTGLAQSGAVSFGNGTVVSSDPAQRARDPRRGEGRGRCATGPAHRDGGRRGGRCSGRHGRRAVDQLAIYRQIDQVDVVPALRIARLGGGRVDPVAAQFEALASTRLPGGEVLPLGSGVRRLDLVPFDAEARRTEDDKFAGHFDRRGRFLPGAAGPNPAREYLGRQCRRSRRGGDRGRR